MEKPTIKTSLEHFKSIQPMNATTTEPPSPAILMLLQFPEDVLRKLLALVPCADRKQLRLCCKHLCTLANATFNTLLLDRDLQHVLLHPPTPPASRPPSPLSFLSRLPHLPACTLHPSLNPHHLPALLSHLPALNSLSALPLPLTPDTLPALAHAPPTLRSLHLATHLAAVRTPLLRPRPRPRPTPTPTHAPTSTPDPLPLPPLTTLTHLTLHSVVDAPAPPGEPLPGLRALAACPALRSLTLRYSTSSRYILDANISAHHWLDPLSALPLLSALTLVFDHTCDPTWEPPADLHLPPLPHLTQLTAQSNALLSSLHNAPALRSLTLLPPRYAYTHTDWPAPSSPPPFPPPSSPSSSSARPHPRAAPLRHLTHLTLPGHLLALPNVPPLKSLKSLTLSPAFERATPPDPFLATLAPLLPHLSDLTLNHPPAAPPLPAITRPLAPLLAAHPHLRARLLAAPHDDPPPPLPVCGSPPSAIQYLPADDYDTNVQHLRLMWFATCAENDGADVIYHEKPAVACPLESASSSGGSSSSSSSSDGLGLLSSSL